MANSGHAEKLTATDSRPPKGFRMADRKGMAVWLAAAAICVPLLMPAGQCRAADAASGDRAALDKELDGWLLWTSGPTGKGTHPSEWKVYKMKIGEWKPIDLCVGRYARWSWDGTRITVWRTQKGSEDEARYAGPSGSLYVTDADGENARKVVGDVWGAGAPMDWMPGDKEIVFTRKTDGGHGNAGKMMAVNVETGKTREIAIADKANAEPQVSADGQLIAAREKYDPHKPLVVYDLKAGKRIEYGRGCCAGISPDGRWASNNFDGHNRMTLHGIGHPQKIFGAGSWDNAHWSNHDNYIASSVDGYGELKVFKVSEQRWFLLADAGSFPGLNFDYPDLFITNLDSAPKLVIEQVEEGSTDWKTAKSWPGDHTALVFTFADSSQANPVMAGGKVVRTCELSMEGFAHLGRGYVMAFPGAVMDFRGKYEGGEGPGQFAAQKVTADALLEQVSKSGQFSVEFVATPGENRISRNRWEIPGAIVAFGPKGKRPNFVVWQSKGDISMQMGPAKWKTPTKGVDKGAKVLTVDPREVKTTHAIFTWADGKLTVYRNGRQIAQMVLPGDVKAWEPGELMFGNLPDGFAPWCGLLEGVCIYARQIGPGEAARKFELYDKRLRKRRKATPTYTVRAKVVSTVPIPDPKSLTDYPRATVVYTYEVTRGPKDVAELAAGKRINVVQWAVLGGKVCPSMKHKFVKGASLKYLTIEPWDAHGEASTERRVFPEETELMDLPMYMCIGEGRWVPAVPDHLVEGKAAR